MDFRKELWTKTVSLGIVGLQIVFEAKAINEITQINSADSEENLGPSCDKFLHFNVHRMERSGEMRVKRIDK